jgi:hypothetical protein
MLLVSLLHCMQLGRGGNRRLLLLLLLGTAAAASAGLADEASPTLL